MLSTNGKCLITALSLVMVSGCLYMFGYVPLMEDNAQAKETILSLSELPTEKSGLDNKLMQLSIESDALNTELGEAKKLKELSFSPKKEEFLKYVTDGVNLYNLEMVYFYDLSYETSNVKNRFTFNIRGELQDITTFCRYLNSLNIKFSVGDFSIRQAMDLDYLERDFEGVNKLSWFNNNNNNNVSSESDNTVSGGVQVIQDSSTEDKNTNDNSNSSNIVVNDSVDNNIVSGGGLIINDSNINNNTSNDVNNSTNIGMDSIEDRLMYLLNSDNFNDDNNSDFNSSNNIINDNSNVGNNIVNDYKEQEIIEETPIEDNDSSKVDEIPIENLIYNFTVVLEY